MFKVYGYINICNFYHLFPKVEKKIKTSIGSSESLQDEPFTSAQRTLMC
jgi:hypothetical protein